MVDATPNLPALLSAHGGNLSALSRALNLPRATLRRQLRAAGLPPQPPPAWVEPPGLTPHARAYVEDAERRAALPVDDPARITRQALHRARLFAAGRCRCGAPRGKAGECADCAGKRRKKKDAPAGRIVVDVDSEAV